MFLALVLSLLVSPSSVLKLLIFLMLGMTLWMNKSQLVSLLLVMESFVCLMYAMVIIKASMSFFSFSMSLVFICIMVCEAMVGIGILIFHVRNKGNNLIQF